MTLIFHDETSKKRFLTYIIPKLEKKSKFTLTDLELLIKETEWEASEMGLVL